MAHQAKADGTTAVRPTASEYYHAQQALLRQIHKECFKGEFRPEQTADWIISIALLNHERTRDQMRQWAAYRLAEGFTDSHELVETQLVRKAALLRKGGRK